MYGTVLEVLWTTLDNCSVFRKISIPRLSSLIRSQGNNSWQPLWTRTTEAIDHNAKMLEVMLPAPNFSIGST